MGHMMLPACMESFCTVRVLSPSQFVPAPLAPPLLDPDLSLFAKQYDIVIKGYAPTPIAGHTLAAF